MMRWAARIAAIALASQLAAQDLLRPVARPEPAVRTAPFHPQIAPVIVRFADADTLRPVARETASTALSDAPLRPVARPDTALAAAQRSFGLGPFAPRRSLRPSDRPQAVEAKAEAARLALLRGQVCGDPAIQGITLGRVSGAGACGIDSAVRVRAVAGVTLSPRATIDCPTARALKTWVERGVLRAVGTEGGGVASLRVVSDYACRTRNNQPGARLSEHAFGRAIDIAGIRLRNGTEMTLLTDWNSAADGAQLRQMWRAACGPFGTVLGPEANRFHRDHFHFDTARYRSGPFCR
ncbi:MAG: extensin family protein [Pseudomonadota bacterium]